MKRLLSHIMLLSIVTHMLYSSGYLLDYYVNTDFYKANCINQDRPELHCDGKCILAQKIAAAAQQDQQDAKDKTMLPASMEYMPEFFCLTISNSWTTGNQVFTHWQPSFQTANILVQFQPPESV